MLGHRVNQFALPSQWPPTSRRDRRSTRWQADPFQVFTDRASVGDGGNDLHAAPTGGAFGDAKLEHSGQKYRPGQPVPPLGGGPLSVTGGRSQRLYLLFRTRYDLRPDLAPCVRHRHRREARDHLGTGLARQKDPHEALAGQIRRRHRDPHCGGTEANRATGTGSVAGLGGVTY